MGIAAAICIVLVPVSRNLCLVWMYASFGVVDFVGSLGLYLCFRNYFRDVPIITGQEVADVELDVAKVAEHGGTLAIEEEVCGSRVDHEQQAS